MTAPESLQDIASRTSADTSAQDIIERIDAAISCGYCLGSLEGSPSDEFCSPQCQELWHGLRSTPLERYQEPKDLPQHVSNCVELSSPEVTSPHAAVVVWARRGRQRGPREVELVISVDLSGFRASLERATEAFRRLHLNTPALAPETVEQLRDALRVDPP